MFILFILSRFLYCIILSLIFRVFNVNKIWISYFVFPLIIFSFLLNRILKHSNLSFEALGLMSSYYVIEFIAMFACQLVANYLIFRKFINIKKSSSANDDILDKDLTD